jgi:hypothetical protein
LDSCQPEARDKDPATDCNQPHLDKCSFGLSFNPLGLEARAEKRWCLLWEIV